MRILATIPHFFRKAATAEYGSERGDAQKRVAALTECITALKQTFGHEQAHMENMRVRANARLTSDIDIVICTSGDRHLVTELPEGLFSHHQTEADARLLGYECHSVLASKIGQYDYYCFMEDDIILSDPLFFWKINWFSETVGNNSVLQPHRYELSLDTPVRKLYIDSRLADPTISPKFQDRSIRPLLNGKVLGQDVRFERVDNPHSGCFFLNQSQMRHWMNQPYFLDRSSAFAGPLESAATLGLMRTFAVYKPSAVNAAFLEVRHFDRRYLGTQIKFHQNFRLQESQN